MSRKLLVATLGCVFALVATTTAAAAPKPPKPDASIEINEPQVTCLVANHVTVTASATTGVDLDGFYLGVQRWEDLNPTMDGWLPRFDMVEHWSASFQQKPVPTSHTLNTKVPGTWADHSWVDHDYYTDVSDIFIINVDAWARAGKDDLRVWGAYAVDCGEVAPSAVPFTWPYEVPRYCESPPEGPRPCGG